MDDENIEEGTSLTKEDEFWSEKMRELTADSTKSIEEAGKQLVAMITVMQAIYAAVLAFSGIKEIAKTSFIVSLLYVSPIILWLVSLYYALLVFKTEKYSYYSNSPDSGKEILMRIANYKQENLDNAYISLCISFGVTIVGILYWFSV